MIVHWLLTLVFRDLLFTEIWLHMVFLEGNKDNSGPLSVHFSENGMESKVLLRNAGSGFVYLVCYVSVALIYTILLQASKKSKR
jgi:hypothetical protein